MADDDDRAQLVGEDLVAGGWWCSSCQGLGGWDEDGAERGDFGDTIYVVCPCCGGDGSHHGGPCGQRREERPPNG